MQLEALRIAPMEDDNSHTDDTPGEFLEDQLDNLLDQADAVEATVVTAGDVVVSGPLTGIAIPCPPAVVNSEVPLDILARIRSCHARVSACESHVDAAKEDLKYAKAQHEEAVSSLMRAVGELNVLGKPLPLFDQPADTEPSTLEPKSTTGKPPLSFADSDAWRSIPISDLGLTKPLAKRLADAGLTTVGAIADHTNSGKRLTDIPGVGEGKAEQIADALERLWAERANHGESE